MVRRGTKNKSNTMNPLTVDTTSVQLSRAASNKPQRWFFSFGSTEIHFLDVPNLNEN